MGKKRSHRKGVDPAAEADPASDSPVEDAPAPRPAIGGDASALANVFAMSGAFFGKKTVYAQPEPEPVKAAKPEPTPAKSEKKLKKKEKKKLKQQQQAETEAKQPEEVEENEEVEEEEEEGDKPAKKKKAKKAKKSKQQPKDGNAEPEADADEAEADTGDAAEAKAKARRTVFVGNVSLDATAKDLTRIFSACGKVETVRLRNLPLAGCAVGDAGNQKLMMKVCANKKIFSDKRETCNAYVVFASEASVESALALDGTMLLDKKLRVDRETPVVDPKRSVFVGNLPRQLPDADLRAFFVKKLKSDEEPAPVESVRVIRDRESGLGKGFGYVLLKSPSLAAKALSLHETKLGNRELRVQVCGKRTKNRRGEEDPSNKHEGLRAAAGARARIQLKRKSHQGAEAVAAKKQKLEASGVAVKTLKPKHAARKAQQAAAVAAGGAKKPFKKPGKQPGKQTGKRSREDARSAPKPKVKKPKHAARKARQAAEAAAAAAAGSS